tara:strand:- start:429 stop:713 length:285 start_codon:yes stop_codon:yes gene_type:complete
MSSKLVIERKDLELLLKENVMQVTFNKINGDKRVMECTLMPSALPPAKKDEAITQEKVRKINEEILVVWDTTASGFRSFRMENVVEVKEIEAVG